MASTTCALRDSETGSGGGGGGEGVEGNPLRSAAGASDMRSGILCLLYILFIGSDLLCIQTMWGFTSFALGVAAPRLHHIPKTAGTSARLMLNKHGHWSIGHTECCFDTIPRDRAVVSFIRKPVEQVYSQFLE